MQFGHNCTQKWLIALSFALCDYLAISSCNYTQILLHSIACNYLYKSLHQKTCDQDFPAKTNLQDHARLCKNLAFKTCMERAHDMSLFLHDSCTILHISCKILQKNVQETPNLQVIILAASLAKSCTISCKICARSCKIVQESCKKRDISCARAMQVLHARFLHNLACSCKFVFAGLLEGGSESIFSYLPCMPRIAPVYLKNREIFVFKRTTFCKKIPHESVTWVRVMECATQPNYNTSCSTLATP